MLEAVKELKAEILIFTGHAHWFKLNVTY